MARILSIEDDPDIQHLIGKILYPEGYELHYAFNGLEGYEKVLSVNPDLILLDLMIPRMNGVELLKKVKGNKGTLDIPVVVVTAYGDEAGMLQKSLEALGAIDYIRKPMQIDDLVRRVKAALANHPRRRRAEALAELRKGAVRADPRYRTVWINDRLVATLPYKRFQLLARLLTSDGPVRKEDLLRELGYGAEQGNALEKALQRLREDFGPKEARRIQTTPQGYELIG